MRGADTDDDGSYDVDVAVDKATALY